MVLPEEASGYNTSRPHIDGKRLSFKLSVKPGDSIAAPDGSELVYQRPTQYGGGEWMTPDGHWIVISNNKGFVESIEELGL